MFLIAVLISRRTDNIIRCVINISRAIIVSNYKGQLSGLTVSRRAHKRSAV